MKELTHPAWIKVKGILFLIVGLSASILLVIEHPTWKTITLLAIPVQCLSRFYYFAFYVIEKYVDPGYKFSGLWSLARYLMRRPREGS